MKQIQFKTLSLLLVVSLCGPLFGQTDAEEAKVAGSFHDFGDVVLVVSSVKSDDLATCEVEGSGQQFILDQSTKKMVAGEQLPAKVRYFEFIGMNNAPTPLEKFKPVSRQTLKKKFPDSLLSRDASKRYRVIDIVSIADDVIRFRDSISLAEWDKPRGDLNGSEKRFVKKWKPATPAPVVEVTEVHGKTIKRTYTAKCVAITDGDTIKVLIDRKTELDIRIDSIDAPEKKNSQPFGMRSKQALSNLIFGRDVIVHDTGKKSWGRDVAFLSIDGKDVGAEMVRQGFAWNSLKYSKSNTLGDLESEARNAKRGLWGDSEEPIPPWEFRKPKKETSQTE